MGRKYGTFEEEFKRKYYRQGEEHMNKVTLFGRVGGEPETKNINGNYVAEFSLATTMKWKTKDGEQKEKTEWHNIAAWGNTAKLVKEYVVKGKRLLVDGGISYQTWDKTDGSKGYKTVIKANNVQVIDWPEKPKDNTDDNTAPAAQPDFTADDIPF